MLTLFSKIALIIIEQSFKISGRMEGKKKERKEGKVYFDPSQFTNQAVNVNYVYLRIMVSELCFRNETLSSCQCYNSQNPFINAPRRKPILPPN